jgi:hypothetical protein
MCRLAYLRSEPPAIAHLKGHGSLSDRRKCYSSGSHLADQGADRDSNSDYCAAYHSLGRRRIRLQSIRAPRPGRCFGPRPRNCPNPLAPWAALNADAASAHDRASQNPWRRRSVRHLRECALPSTLRSHGLPDFDFRPSQGNHGERKVFQNTDPNCFGRARIVRMGVHFIHVTRRRACCLCADTGRRRGADTGLGTTDPSQGI